MAGDKKRGGSGDGLPASTSELEREIQARRDHLASTIDELAARTKPQALARSGVASVQAKVYDATHDDRGSVRVERLAAVGGALVAVTGLLVWLRRRRS